MPHTVNGQFAQYTIDAPSTPVAGELLANASAQALGNQACHGATIIVDPDASVGIYLGDANSQPVKLSPGMSIYLHVANVNKLYAKVQSGSGPVSVAWIANNPIS